jgi:hypothetical protein
LNLIIAHIGLATVLFFLLNWIGNHSIHTGYIRMSILAKADEAPAFNFIYRVFSPVAYITVVSAVFYQLNQNWLIQNIYLVVVYYFVFRLAFNLLTERRLLLNWFTQIAYMLVSIPMSYYVYDKLILHKEFLFPTADELGSAVWLAIIAYVYHTFNSVKFSDERTKTRKANYLDNRYKKYKNTYGTIIENIARAKHLEALIYAILITEAFNRPKAYRLIENLLFHFGFAKTLGIMQVTTEKYINDIESVKLGAKKIVNDYEKAELKKKEEKEKLEDGEDAAESYTLWQIRRETIEQYNPDNDYIREVDDLYDEIFNKYYSSESVQNFVSASDSSRNCIIA